MSVRQKSLVGIILVAGMSLSACDYIPTTRTIQTPTVNRIAAPPQQTVVVKKATTTKRAPARASTSVAAAPEVAQCGEAGAPACPKKTAPTLPVEFNEGEDGGGGGGWS